MNNFTDKNRPSLQIAIPAYNEERTIENVLARILAQNRNSFALDKIVVYSDGSTDRTPDIVNRVSRAHKEVSLLEKRERRGKANILNEIFADLESEFLIVLDADIGIKGEDFLDTMVKNAIANPEKAMLAAHQIPLRPKNFVARMLYASYAMWDSIRFGVPRKDHVQNYYGAATLYRKSFAKNLRIPNGAVEERVYQYLMAKRAGGFKYIDDAVIYYWPPITWHDFIAHANRTFGTEQILIKKHFGEEASNVHIIPVRYKITGILKYFIRDPIYAPFALALNFMLSRLTLRKPERKTALWEISESTKIPIKAGSTNKKIIISSYDNIKNPAYGGGGAHAVHEVAKRLARNFEVRVLYGNHRGATDEVREGVAYKRIGFSIFGPKLGQLLYHFFIPIRAMTEDFDLWIESFTPPFSSSFTPLFTRRPVIGLVHMLAAKDMQRKYRISFRIIENLGLKFYKYFIVLTGNNMEEVKSKNKFAEVRIIPNGVNLPQSEEVKNRKDGHISFMSRIEIDQKGLDFLIGSFAEISRKVNIRLAIAGYGSKKNIAELGRIIKNNGLKDKVDVVGYVEGRKKDEFLEKTKIGVVTSRFETFSLAALEMMSRGIPVVAFDIPGTEWIPEGAAVKIKAFDKKMFADGIMKLLLDDDYYRKISQSAIAEAKKYDWDKIADMYKDFIWKII